MKVLKKRAIALLIDGFILGIYYEFLRLLLPENFFNLGVFSYIIIFVPFFFRDCIFKNASIGKKIVGIKVFTIDWTTPSVLLLAKRALFMATIGYVLWWKIKVTDGKMISLFDCEREKIKTTIICTKVYEELKEKAQISEGDFRVNMTNLYNEYLRTYY
jgi:uncharacterized RDD family membrane protein YckC